MATRKRTGTLEPFTSKDGKRYYRGRIRLADGTRERVDVPPGMSLARMRDWVEATQEKEDKFGLLYKAKRKRNGVVEGSTETVDEWMVRWFEWRRSSGVVAEGNTDPGRAKQHISPVIGGEVMAIVTKDRIEDVRDAIDAKIRAGVIKWKTASHAWGLVTSMFRAACTAKDRSLRMRQDNPASDVAGPERGSKTSKVFLYPAEFEQLVACEKVPIEWRRLFAVTVYLYARAGEIKALNRSDLDLERGVAFIHQAINRETGKVKETKTGETRRLPIEKELLPLLRAMIAEGGTEGRLITDMPVTDRKLARQLKAQLVRAGIKRAELLKGSATTKSMTFHDLRATGITWCAVRGDDPLKVMQRAGHRTFSTTQGYIREAENLRDGFGLPFPPLPRSILGNQADTTPPEGSDERANERPNSPETTEEDRGIQGGGAGNRRRHQSALREESRPNVDVGGSEVRRSADDNPTESDSPGPTRGPKNDPLELLPRRARRSARASSGSARKVAVGVAKCLAAVKAGDRETYEREARPLAKRIERARGAR